MRIGLMAVMGALVVALGGYGVVQRMTNARLAAELADLRAQLEQLERTAPIGKAPGERARTAGAPEGKPGGTDAAPGAARALPKGDGADEANGKDRDGKPGDLLKRFASIVDDPAMKSVLEQQTLIAVNGMYGDLFRELGLSEEAEEAFRKLLVEKQTAATEMAMKLLDRSRTPEERREIAEGFKSEAERIRAEIRAALGEDSFKSYEMFEDSQQERQQLQAYKQALGGEGKALPLEVEQQLMTAMYETRKGFKFSTDFGSDTSPNPEAILNFDKAVADRYLIEFRALQELQYARARAILSGEQLAAFQESQEAVRKVQEMGMSMSLGFLGEGP